MVKFGPELLSDEARKQFGIKKNPETKILSEKDTSVLSEAGQTGVLEPEAGRLPSVEFMETAQREIIEGASKGVDAEQKLSIQRGREKLQRLFPDPGMQKPEVLRAMTQNPDTDPDVRMALLKDEEEFQDFVKKQNEQQRLLVEGRKKLKEFYEKAGEGNMNVLLGDYSKIDPALDLAIKEQRAGFAEARNQIKKKQVDPNHVQFGQADVAEFRKAVAQKESGPAQSQEFQGKKSSESNDAQQPGVLGKLKKFFLG